LSEESRAHLDKGRFNAHFKISDNILINERMLFSAGVQDPGTAARHHS